MSNRKPHVEMGIEMDVAYLRLAEGAVARTVDVVPDRILLDLDDAGRLLGIEILGVTVPFEAKS